MIPSHGQEMIFGMYTMVCKLGLKGLIPFSWSSIGKTIVIYIYIYIYFCCEITMFHLTSFSSEIAVTVDLCQVRARLTFARSRFVG